jgi:hypothetical protein
MSSRLTFSQISGRITGRLQPFVPLDAADLPVRLESPATIGPLLDALAVEPSPLRRALEESIADFTRRHPDLVRRYLRRETSLPTLAQAFLGFLAEAGTACEHAEIMNSVAATDERLDWAISSHLPKRRERFALCGFGLGNGAYEQQLATRLTQQGTAVELFGYDPENACFDPEAIKTCTLATLLQADAYPLFDMILTRWVLHHVRPAQRWQALVACVHHCRPGGSLLIVEEGTFSSERSTAILLYEFLSGCADVLVNAVLYPDWLRVGDHPGEHFYLQYLTPADIQALEAAFAMTTQRHIEWHQAGFFPQILISYTFFAPARAHA